MSIRSNTKVAVAVMHGDQTGEELLEQALRLTEEDVLGIDFELEHFDLSLENRRKTDNKIVHEAGDAMRACGLGFKAATITPETSGDVGSPNAILREALGASVILRTGRRIPQIRPLGVSMLPLRLFAWRWMMPTVPKNGEKPRKRAMKLPGERQRLAVRFVAP